jgi:hypothetical protein
MSKTLFSICIIFFTCVAASPGLSEDRGLRIREHRLALVIGNAGYIHSPLKNPVNDARDMAGSLQKLGFDVIHKENVGQREFEEAIRDFGIRLRKVGGVGLFYYAGHGVQVQSDNFLIPIDARIYQETDIKYEAIHAGRVLDAMYNAANRMNIVILDACRDNPFARSFRSSAKGLARMDAPTGTLIAYATSPGNVAADGDRRNSYYTKHLLKQMPDPKLTIEKVFKNVRVGVIQETNNRQVPWESSSLTGDFYFNTPKRRPTQSPPGSLKLPAPPPTHDIEKYESIIQERKKAREQWDAWQTKMGDQFEKAGEYDSSPELTPQEKLDVWQTFLAFYGADNPYSTEDEAFRNRALTKKSFWHSKVSETKHPAPKSDRSPPAAKPFLPAKAPEMDHPEKTYAPNKQHQTQDAVGDTQKKIIILPFDGVAVGKGKDIDINVIFPLLQEYGKMKIGASYYKGDTIQVGPVIQDITRSDAQKIYSYRIDSNNRMIADLSRKFAAEIVLLAQKTRRKVKIPFQDTQSNDPNKRYEVIYTMHVHIVDIENQKTFTASEDYSGGLFFDTNPVVRSIIRAVIDQYLSSARVEKTSDSLASER